MKQKIFYRRVYIRDCEKSNPHFNALFDIFRLTLKPDMLFREFTAYYYSKRLDYIDATFVFFDGKVIGFCAAAFYRSVINEKKYVIGRAATGILESYRGQAMPKWKLYKKYICYWIRHPFKNIILSAYVANPIIYAMICKYTGIAYPRENAKPPENIIELKNELLRSQNLHRKEEKPFVVEIHFSVKIADKDKKRIFESKDGAVKYFLHINPKFIRQYGVVVIIPVSLKNILLSSFKFLYHYSVKFLLISVKLFHFRPEIERNYFN
ncbi:MAG TPA: hypothetical protein VKT28_15145 [Puia sp.]|nr:hypothetical protein [Puia sp.]